MSLVVKKVPVARFMDTINFLDHRKKPENIKKILQWETLKNILVGEIENLPGISEGKSMEISVRDFLDIFDSPDFHWFPL